MVSQVAFGGPLSYRRCVLLLAIACLGVSSLVSGDEPRPQPAAKLLTAEQQKRLKERDRYAAEAAKLWDAGKETEAIAAWEKKLAIEREVLGDMHEEVIDSLRGVARLHEAREDFARARKALKEVLAVRGKLHGEKDWRVTDARLALEELDQLARLDRTSRQRLQRALALDRRVVHLHEQERFREALPLAQQALAIRNEILGGEASAVRHQSQQLGNVV